MSKHERTYYLRRAEAELALARGAAHPAAMRAHYHLAGFYLDKAHGASGVRQACPDNVPVKASAPVHVG